jgi:hypothetical protein
MKKKNNQQQARPRIPRSLRLFIRDEEGFVSKETILNVGLTAIGVVGLLGISSDVVNAAHSSHASHSSSGGEHGSTTIPGTSYAMTAHINDVVYPATPAGGSCMELSPPTHSNVAATHCNRAAVHGSSISTHTNVTPHANHDSY